MYRRDHELSPEAKAYQAQVDAQLAEARRTLAAADERERQRIAAIVEKYDAPARAREAERKAAERAAEQEQEARRQAEAQAREDAEREHARGLYLAAGGPPEAFDGWWIAERVRRADERLAQQRAAMWESTRRSF